MPRGILKPSLLLVGTLGMSEALDGAPPAPTARSLQSRPQTEVLVAVVQRWAKAWGQGDTDAMAACLHPDLARHILGLEQPTSREALKHGLGVQSLLGKSVHKPAGDPEVRVLDAQGRSGSARVDLGPWTAYLHLAAHRDSWAIANVLWEWRS